jgi:hypothetical protein
VAIARRLGDPTTLAYALDAHYGATFWYDCEDPGVVMRPLMAGSPQSLSRAA